MQPSPPNIAQRDKFHTAVQAEHQNWTATSCFPGARITDGLPESDSESDHEMQSSSSILSALARDVADIEQVYESKWVDSVYVQRSTSPGDTPIWETITDQRMMRAQADTIFTPKEALRFKQAHDCVEDYYYHRMPSLRTYVEEVKDSLTVDVSTMGHDVVSEPNDWTPLRHQQACNRLHGPERHACQLFIPSTDNPEALAPELASKMANIIPIATPCTTTASNAAMLQDEYRTVMRDKFPEGAMVMTTAGPATVLNHEGSSPRTSTLLFGSVPYSITMDNCVWRPEDYPEEQYDSDGRRIDPHIAKRPRTDEHVAAIARIRSQLRPAIESRGSGHRWKQQNRFADSEIRKRFPVGSPVMTTDGPATILTHHDGDRRGHATMKMTVSTGTANPICKWVVMTPETVWWRPIDVHDSSGAPTPATMNDGIAPLHERQPPPYSPL